MAKVVPSGFQLFFKLQLSCREKGAVKGKSSQHFPQNCIEGNFKDREHLCLDDEPSFLASTHKKSFQFLSSSAAVLYLLPMCPH